MRSTERLWLALNIYHEARGEPIEGQIAVAHVTLNRCEFRKRSVKDVVLQAWQFSWANNGARPTIKDYAALEKSFHVVDLTLQERADGKDLSDCDHYFNDEIPKPYWANGMMFYKQIGKHLFYYRG